ELPNGFSTLSMILTTDWVSGKRDLFDFSNDTIPLVCIRSGGPPLPGSLVESDLITALSVGYMHNMSNMGQCAWFRESLRVNMTEEQVSSGILYLGFFNGVGPIRTQSKMISRGSAYTVDAEIIILGCKSSFLGGLYCNNTVNSLTCPQVDLYDHPRKLYENPLNRRKHWKTGDFYAPGKGPAQQLGHMDGNCLFQCRENVNGKKNKRLPVSGSTSQIKKIYHLSKSSKHELICSNSQDKECIKNGKWKFFSLEVVDISSLLELMVEYENFNSSASEQNNIHNASNDTIEQTEVEATIYVRHNAFPQKTLYEYSLPAGQPSLRIQFPKLGWWYVGAYFSNISKQQGGREQEKEEALLCFVLKWRIYACTLGKAGDECKWQINTLKRVKGVGANLHLESHYLPINQEESAKSGSFPTEPFFSNSATVEASQDEWTFFLFEVPHGAAGGVISIELRSYPAMSFDIYARFGSLPTLQVWDYHTNISDAVERLIFTAMKDANKWTKIHLNIIYPHEGIWCLGLRRSSGHNLKPDSRQATVSVSLQGCPNHCSKHGTCQHEYEESGLTSFRFFMVKPILVSNKRVTTPLHYLEDGNLDINTNPYTVDLDDVDEQSIDVLSLERQFIHVAKFERKLFCYSVHIIPAETSSESEKMVPSPNRTVPLFMPIMIRSSLTTMSSLRSMPLIDRAPMSEKQMLLFPEYEPNYLQNKAYAEWILYTASGISSALYHSCDAGSWCALSYRVLQFMDFWLSFMAVVATFIYMASVDDKTKVAVHTSTAIITALIAVNGPTRSINIILVVVIGILGLLFGWMVEFCRSDQITVFRSYFNLTIHERWKLLKTGPRKLWEKLNERFRWCFISMGFLALGASGLSWHFETVKTYWFWH
ncbi:hypothetical protein KI387_004769, partial [Taxus chinensis]